MRLLHTICVWMLTLIGIVHICFGFLTFQDFSTNLLWFIGSGLAMIFIGLLNFMFRLNSTQRLAYGLNQIGNLLLFFFVITVNSIALMPPGIIGLIVLMLLLFSSYKIYVLASESHT
ncbi:MAG: hypothetical protein HEP71_02235 [Roseivirga sp.]|nr:hypothetical protein [Roseivirga sp.]